MLLSLQTGPLIVLHSFSDPSLPVLMGPRFITLGSCLSIPQQSGLNNHNILDSQWYVPHFVYSESLFNRLCGQKGLRSVVQSDSVRFGLDSITSDERHQERHQVQGKTHASNLHFWTQPRSQPFRPWMQIIADSHQWTRWRTHPGTVGSLTRFTVVQMSHYQLWNAAEKYWFCSQ